MEHVHFHSHVVRTVFFDVKACLLQAYAVLVFSSLLTIKDDSFLLEFDHYGSRGELDRKMLPWSTSNIDKSTL
jgi:hypothetical protein